jgi:TatD DNase family protein
VRFADSHVHLADFEDWSGVLRWASASETLLMTNGTDGQTSRKGVQLAAEYPDKVAAFAGVHPSEAGKENGLTWVESVARKATGLGEIGLDPKYPGFGEGGPQLRAFEAQLGVAERLKKPVQVHARDAEELCMHILGSWEVRTVLLHWFEGESLAPTAASRGYYVSFGPALLYSKKLARIAAGYPLDRLLTESDGPVPFAALGGASGPSLVPSVVFELASIRRMSAEEMRAQLALNAGDFLEGKGKG